MRSDAAGSTPGVRSSAGTWASAGYRATSVGHVRRPESGLSTGGLYNLTLSLCDKGDLNNDNVIDVLDVVQMVNLIMNGYDYSCEPDMNSDNVINILDIVSLVSVILS